MVSMNASWDLALTLSSPPRFIEDKARPTVHDKDYVVKWTQIQLRQYKNLREMLEDPGGGGGGTLDNLPEETSDDNSVWSRVQANA